MAQRGRPKGMGKTPGSGRKKGTPNKIKSTAVIRAEMAELQAAALARVEETVAKQTPLEFALQCMRDESYPPGFHLEACKVAMPYIHAKKAEEIGEKPVVIEKIERVIVHAKPQPDDQVQLEELERTVVEPGVVRAEMASDQPADPVAVARDRIARLRGAH
jgi:hypothetical protein